MLVKFILKQYFKNKQDELKKMFAEAEYEYKRGKGETKLLFVLRLLVSKYPVLRLCKKSLKVVVQQFFDAEFVNNLIMRQAKRIPYGYNTRK